MRLITERHLVRDAAARCAARYPLRRPGTWEAQMYTALQALDAETATAADVAALVGHDHWTTVVCDECKSRVTTAVQVGAEPDYESRTAMLCTECVAQAWQLLTPVDEEEMIP